MAAQVLQILDGKHWRRFLIWAAGKPVRSYGVLPTLARQFVDDPAWQKTESVSEVREREERERIVSAITAKRS